MKDSLVNLQLNGYLKSHSTARGGVILDSQPTLSAHVAALCRSGYYQLRQLCPLVQSMTVEAARTATAAFISCRLDSCNSRLYGLPDTLSRKLQSVQNATARLITGVVYVGVGDTFLAVPTIFNKILQLVVKINIF